MRKKLLYLVVLPVMVSCQHSLQFPVAPVVSVAPQKQITAIVVTNPAETDYDSMVFRYSTGNTREVHYDQFKDSTTRTYSYDAGGRLSSLEDEKAIYYTNNDVARRIRFLYNETGQLRQTLTDFTAVSGLPAWYNISSNSSNTQIIAFDTAYRSSSYNLDWSNHIIYSVIDNRNKLLYDSGVFANPSNTGLFKTFVNEYSYGSDSSVTGINKRIYFNGQLAEYGTVHASIGQAAPLYLALHKNLYRNLSNWFDVSLAWQDDGFRIFPLAGGPYTSILYTGYSTTSGVAPYTRNFNYDNSYGGDDLNSSVVKYELLGQGTSRYTTVIRYYYK